MRKLWCFSKKKNFRLCDICPFNLVFRSKNWWFTNINGFTVCTHNDIHDTECPSRDQVSLNNTSPLEINHFCITAFSWVWFAKVLWCQHWHSNCQLLLATISHLLAITIHGIYTFLNPSTILCNNYTSAHILLAFTIHNIYTFLNPSNILCSNYTSVHILLAFTINNIYTFLNPFTIVCNNYTSVHILLAFTIHNIYTFRNPFTILYSNYTSVHILGFETMILMSTEFSRRGGFRHQYCITSPNIHRCFYHFIFQCWTHFVRVLAANFNPLHRQTLMDLGDMLSAVPADVGAVWTIWTTVRADVPMCVHDTDMLPEVCADSSSVGTVWTPEQRWGTRVTELTVCSQCALAAECRTTRLKKIKYTWWNRTRQKVHNESERNRRRTSRLN